MNVLVVACSLNQKSRSAVLAAAAVAELERLGCPTRLIDLRETALPICDAGPAYGDPNAAAVAQAVARADAILLAVPIYNYDVNAAAKNLVELSGKAWSGKTVGFLCAAGGRGSFMSVMGLANSLMLDFRCLIVPRFVYATGDDFLETGEPAPAMVERIDELAAEVTRITSALLTTGTTTRDSRPLAP